ncbi:MAG: hypothetical protein F6K16_39235 [Symploca sp. SIO2B6]|nr:hypothetical protein [Symploca sp. SIO2B6]
MRRTILLTTSGYEFIIYLSSLRDSRDRLGVITCIVPNKNFELSSIRSQVKTIFLEDLSKLYSYLDLHLERKLIDDSYVFMGYDCSFQIQALRGVMAPLTSNSLGDTNIFTIRCLVNVGSTNNTSFSEYFGGESVVTVGNCRKFMKSLEESYTKFKFLLAEQ